MRRRFPFDPAATRPSSPATVAADRISSRRAEGTSTQSGNECFDASWVTHINGNALYRPTLYREFTAMISQCAESNRGSKSFMSSFDAAMWIQHVTSYASKWEKYQNYAHKFQYTDLIQSLNKDVSWPVGARDLVARSPNTFSVHGSSASAGEEHRKKTFENGVAVDISAAQVAAKKKKLSPLSLPDEVAEEEILDDDEQQLTFRPKVFLPGKVAVVIPLIASQIEKLRVLFSLSSKDAFRPCDPGKVSGGKALPIDLVFQISSTCSTRAAPPATKHTTPCRPSLTSSHDSRRASTECTPEPPTCPPRRTFTPRTCSRGPTSSSAG